MVSAAVRRARWASIRDRWRPVTIAALIALGGLRPTAPRPGRPVGYSIEERPDGLVLRLASPAESPRAEIAVVQPPSLAPAEHPGVPPTPESADAGQGTETAQTASSTAAEGGSAGVLALRDSA